MAGERETVKLRMLKEAMARAQDRLADQGEVMAVIRGVAFDGKWPDGSPVKRQSVRLSCLKLMASGVPEKLIEKTVGVGETAEKRQLTVHLVLDAKVDQLEASPPPKLLTQDDGAAGD